MKTPALLINISVLWRPGFLREFLKKDKVAGISWGLWFFWHVIIALVVAVAATMYASSFITQANEDLYSNFGDIQIESKGGKFSTTLPEPFVIKEEEFALVIETKTKRYSEEVLDDFASGIYVDADTAYFKTNHKIETINFAEIEDFFLSQEQMYLWLKENHIKIAWIIYGIAALAIFIFNAVVHLLAVLAVSFVLYIIAMIAGIKKLGFPQSFLYTLNCYIPVMIIDTVLWYVGINISFATLIIFTLITVWQIYNLKKK